MMKNNKKLLKVTVGVLMLLLSTVLICVAVAAGASEIADDASFSGVNAAISGNVSLNFYYSDLGSAEHMVTEITYPDGSVKKSETAREDIPFDQGKGLYFVRVPLAPSQMSYNVKVYAEDQNGAGTAKEYSVLKYAQEVLADNSLADYHNSMRSLLNWGAMAQVLFGNAENEPVNEGLYTRDTNPIDNVASFYSGKGEVNSTEHMTGKEFTMSLDPGSTALNFYVNYTGSGTLSASVSKNGVAGVPAAVTYVGDDGEAKTYRVKINNVGAITYSTPYTVSVTDGSETFTVTKTALEYLNTLAFASGEDAKYNDIAKAMYQFYSNIVPNVMPTDCPHTSMHWRSNGKGASYAECSTCFESVYSYAVKDNVERFLTAQQLVGSAPSASSPVLTAENGGSYLTLNGYDAGSSWWGWNVISDASAPISGKYMLIKYRIDGGENGFTQSYIRMFTSTTAATATSNTEQCRFMVKTDSEWHTAIVDLSTTQAYTAAADGSYSATLLQIRPFQEGDGGNSEGAKMDIEYIAFCDKLGEATGASDAEVYEYSLGYNSAVPYDRETVEDLSGVYDISPKELASYTVLTNAPATLMRDGDTEYVRITGAGEDTPSYFTYPYDNAKGNSGGYLIFKYRTDFTASGWLTLRTSSVNSALPNRGNHTTDRSWTTHDKANPGTWQVFIVDMKQNKNSNGVNSLSENGNYSAKYFSMDFFYEGQQTKSNYMDIAYIKWADTADEAHAIASGEANLKFGYYGSNWTGLTYVPDPCISGHTLSTSGSYTLTCSVCGKSENRNVLSDIPAYINPNDIPKAWNADGTGTKKIMYEDGAFFVRLSHTSNVQKDGTVDATACVITKSEITSGRYVVVKYRTSCTLGDSKIYMYVRSTSISDQSDVKRADTGMIAYKDQPSDGEWAVGYFDISGTAVESYITSGRTTEITFTMNQTTMDGSTYSLDVAYAAVVDTVEQAEALLAGEEALESIGSKSVSEYNKELEGMITDKKENELQFLVFADVHTGLYSWNRIVDYYNQYSSYIDFALHAGDYAGGNLGGFVDLYGTGKAPLKPIFNVVGNHDTMPAGTSTSADIGTAPQAEVFNKLFGTSDTWGVTFMDGENTMAYYIDYPEKNIRFIALDNYYDQDAQTVWLKALLDDAKDKNMHVLTCMHQASGAVVTPVNTSFHTTMPTNGFEYSPFDAIIGDFIKGGGKFIANLAGHWHIDLFGYTANGVLNIAIETASPDKVPANQLDGRPQTTGNRNYDAFDVININAQEGVFELVRIGNNTDGASRTKTSLKYDYINGRMLYENGVEVPKEEVNKPVYVPNYYDIDANELKTAADASGSPFASATTLLNEDGVDFVRINNTSVETSRFIYNYSESEAHAGQYLIIKYRTNAASGWMSVSTSNSASPSAFDVSNKTWHIPVGDGVWHVIVFDLSRTVADNSSIMYTPDGDGKYAPLYFGVAPFYGKDASDSSKYVDIAYVSFADSTEHVMDRIGDGEDVNIGYYLGGNWYKTN